MLNTYHMPGLITSSKAPTSAVTSTTRLSRNHDVWLRPRGIALL